MYLKIFSYILFTKLREREEESDNYKVKNQSFYHEGNFVVKTTVSKLWYIYKH